MKTIGETDALLARLRAEGAPAPEIIRQLAEACLGWPYVFGAWGEKCTPAGRRRRVRDDHPAVKSKCPALNGGSCSGCGWGGGVRMFDCRGFTAWLVRQAGSDLAGEGASSQYDTASNWVRRGPAKEMPDCVCCVFRRRDGRMEHTGMHLGGGRVIDCSAGVSSVGMGGWTHYGIPKGLYSEEEIPMETVKPILRRGASDDSVRELQDRLTLLGFPCGAIDGVFGTRTFNALVAFQTEMKLDPDGVCGPKTWRALAAAPARTDPADRCLLLVVIDGATPEEFNRILAVCPHARAVREEAAHA